jgi:hypothetical protein
MPAKSLKQLKFIYAKRAQYKTKTKAPEKYKWVFDEEWGHLKENVKIMTFQEFDVYLDSIN